MQNIVKTVRRALHGINGRIIVDMILCLWERIVRVDKIAGTLHPRLRIIEMIALLDMPIFLNMGSNATTARVIYPESSNMDS